MSARSSWEGRPVRAHAEAWGVPYLEIHDTLPSTQDRARALAAEGRPPWSVVLADAQTAGRGRSGARWLSEPGTGLWMSVLLPAGAGPHLSLAVGLAVAEAVARAAPDLPSAGIEWPNDVTIEDRKIAGVLLEASGSGIVAGIGLNTRTPPGGYPPELGGRAAALDAWPGGGHVDRAVLAGQVLEMLRQRVARPRPRPDAELLAALRSRDALAGREVDTEQEGRGRAVGLAEDGALLLERADGRGVAVRSGRVRPVRADAPVSARPDAH